MTATATPIRDQFLLAHLRRHYAETINPLERYRFDPAGYIREHFGWEPWSGTEEQPGQMQIIEAYTRALRQQVERRAWERGEISESQLVHWQPGQTIQNWLRIEAGHTVGKTKLAAGLVNHFFDTFTPSIVYTFAPTQDQIKDLLWKEIKADRRAADLPGRILDLRLDRGPDHFAQGRATSNAGNTGTERVQGQHGEHLMFVLDEAEGIADYVFSALDSMTSGGIVIVVLLANPRTRTSQFHKVGARADCRSFRISCLQHPNVLTGREIVPNAVRREYVEKMVADHCEIVAQHDPDRHTFTLPWRPDMIYRPRSEFLWRVMGIAPAHESDDTFVPVGRYEAALAREEPVDHPHAARMGVDVARYGRDEGTLYIRHNGRVWCERRFAQQSTTAYARAIIEAARQLIDEGVTSLHIRVDGGGGFGGGVIDQLRRDLQFAQLIEQHVPDFLLLEVQFGGMPYNWQAYADLATEMYATAADALQYLALERVPEALSGDLCERTYRWMTYRGLAVKRLEPKEDFRKRMGRSPDDGDGFVLAAAPDYVFTAGTGEQIVSEAFDDVAISPY